MLMKVMIGEKSLLTKGANLFIASEESEKHGADNGENYYDQENQQTSSSLFQIVHSHDFIIRRSNQIY